MLRSKLLFDLCDLRLNLLYLLAGSRRLGGVLRRLVEDIGQFDRKGSLLEMELMQLFGKLVDLEELLRNRC